VLHWPFAPVRLTFFYEVANCIRMFHDFEQNVLRLGLLLTGKDAYH